MEHVIILVVKGNLKHRLLKLGTELHKDDLTPAQRELRRIAEDQQFGDWPPERPRWANGACLFLTRAHADQIQGCIERQGVHLQSKHVVVSPTHRAALDACLDVKPLRSGREAFLISRAGMVQTETMLVLLPPPPVMGNLDRAANAGSSISCNTRNSLKHWHYSNSFKPPKISGIVRLHDCLFLNQSC